MRKIAILIGILLTALACAMPSTATPEASVPVATFTPLTVTPTTVSIVETGVSPNTQMTETPVAQGFVSPTPNTLMLESYLGASYTLEFEGTVDRFSDIGGDANKHSLIAIYNGNGAWFFVSTFGNTGNADAWLKLWTTNSSATPGAPIVPTFMGGYKDCILDGPGINTRWDKCNVFIGDGDYFTFAGTVVNAGQYVPAEGSLTGYQPIYKYTVTPTATP